MKKMKKRTARKVIYLFFEGQDNKTESLYFSHFKSEDYSLKLIPNGNTDPLGMLDYACAYLKRNTVLEVRDRVFLLIDVDNKQKEAKLINGNFPAKVKKKKFEVIFSNPSFEIWFLNHFVF